MWSTAWNNILRWIAALLEQPNSALLYLTLGLWTITHVANRVLARPNRSLASSVTSIVTFLALTAAVVILVLKLAP